MPAELKIPRRLASPAHRLYLAVELGVVFVALPVALYLERHAFRQWIIPTLLVVALVCLGLLLADPTFDRRRLWNRSGFRPHLRRTVRIFAPAGGLLTVVAAVLQPELFLRLPRERTLLWAVVLVLYPLVSVYPQEVVFRAFFCHRYRRLVPRPRLMIVVSALAFGLAHLLFGNWVAPVLSTLGGLLFAATYLRSRSLLQASIEHSLWGDLLFTLGLGWYFYGGVIGTR